MTPNEIIEILANAARAINLQYNFICLSGANCGDVKELGDYWWNPIENSGDCFEMNITLDSAIEFDDESRLVFVNSNNQYINYQLYDDHNGCKTMATRVASTMVAAKIGKDMLDD